MSDKTKSVTVGQATTALNRAHRAVVASGVRTGVLMFTAGQAMAAAETAGAVTFERVPDSAVPGQETRGGLAKRWNVSPSTVSKYRAIGQYAALGLDTTHPDYGLFTTVCTAKDMTTALAAGKAAVVKALADRRAGIKSDKGTAKGGKGKGNGGDGKAPSSQSPGTEKGGPTTLRTVEERLTEVVTFLGAGNGTRLDSLTPEALATISALLVTASEHVEAAQHRKAAKKARPTAPKAAPVAVAS